MQFGVSESIVHWGKYTPDAPAVYHNGRITSFRELDSLINVLCHEISAANFQCERIAIAVKSKFHLLASLISILRTGKSAVLLNIGLSDEAIRTNINDTKVMALIHDNHYEKIKKFIDGLSENQTLNVSDVLENFRLPTKPFSPAIIRQPKDEWGILFSSGSTGIPKGIERDHNSIVTELLGWCLELGLNRQTSFYIGRPIYYTGGLVLSLATLLVGGKIFLNDFVDDNTPSEVWRDYQSTLGSDSLKLAFFVPDQIRAFVEITKTLEMPPCGAETILVMGAPISGDEKVKAACLLHSRIVESWGNSESLGTITDADDLEKRPNSIGRPFLTDELYIVDERCMPLGPFQHGKIAGSEEAGFLQYSNRPKETDLAKRDDLIISDDIGYIDDDGYVYVCGRDQDCILDKGTTVFIPDIERKLRTNDSIRECCVVANTLSDGSIELVGVIVLSGEVSTKESELIQQLNRTLGEHEQLTRVLLISSMPRLPSGKVDRVAVKRIASDTK